MIDKPHIVLDLSDRPDAGFHVACQWFSTDGTCMAVASEAGKGQSQFEHALQA